MSTAQAAQPPLRWVFETLWRCRALRHLTIANVLINMVCACMASWLPTFFIRSHAMASGELGIWLAAVTSIGGGVGMWLGGHLTTRYGARDERIQTRLLALSAALSAPLLIAALLCASKQGAFLLLLPAYILAYFSYGPTFSLIQGLAEARIRAATIAVVILVQALFAGVIALQLVGILSDALSPRLGMDSLRWTMTVISLLALWAAAHFAWSGRTIRSGGGTCATKNYS
jgi:MFS family permease